MLWPNEHLGSRFYWYGKPGDVKFKNLELGTLTAGELNIIHVGSGKITAEEKSACVQMLGDVMFNMGFYQWNAILRLHAAILSEIQEGRMKWGYAYSRLEQHMVLPFSITKGRQDRKGDRKGAPSNSQKD